MAEVPFLIQEPDVKFSKSFYQSSSANYRSICIDTYIWKIKTVEALALERTGRYS